MTGVAAGPATITATVEGKTATQAMNVIPVPVATVTVTAAASTVQAGSTTQAHGGHPRRGQQHRHRPERVVVDGQRRDRVGLVERARDGPDGGHGHDHGDIRRQDGIDRHRRDDAGIRRTRPTVSAISPATLVEGQSATITGTKFSPDVAGNIVRVGGVAASVTAATATSLQIVVPTLNCKPAQNINVDVSVGGLTSAPKSQPFTPGATFTLAQGQQRILSNSSAFCLQFAATSATESYLVGIQSVSENVASVTSANVVAEVPGSGLVSQTFALPALMTARPSSATRPSFAAVAHECAGRRPQHSPREAPRGRSLVPRAGPRDASGTTAGRETLGSDVEGVVREHADGARQREGR